MDQNLATTTLPPTRGSCLVPGCTCKDARILSARRAAWFVSVARSRGETADRLITPDADWPLPTSPALDARRALAARSMLRSPAVERVYPAA